MNKKTKRTRRNKKNKTRKYYGGFNKVMNNKVIDNKVIDNKKSEGIIDIIGNKLSGYSGKVFDYVKEKGLRLAGLQEIKKEEEPVINDSTQKVDQKINEISDAASGIVSDVKNVFDKGSAAVIGNINDVLDSPEVGKTLDTTAKETAAIGEKLLDNFNKELSTPEMKEVTKEAIENASDVAGVAVEAFDKPLNKAIDGLNNAGQKAASGIASGVIKVGTDAMAAVPGLGAVIEIGKIANDATKSAQDIASAAQNATATVKELAEETRENIDDGFKKLDEKKDGIEEESFKQLDNPLDKSLDNPLDKTLDKSLDKPEETLNQLNKVGGSITNRVNKSIHQFENTNDIHLKGGYKTIRNQFKGKGKTKRVRFAI